ncbi:BQ2448_8008 [Microbotryum intermedium]|uniref:BQ2448_8008 protein n=1 Tax=Microbotryum intermedium TaxID=269621 RepID=A0A238FQB9_9BASI|nr:BQ2448_8008 [Microbotryum intermedium]
MARDEMLVILDVSATVIRAGVGVHEIIRAPTVEVSTRIGKRPSTTTTTTRSASTAQVSDYLVGNALQQAEQAREPLEIVHPFQNGPGGFQVVDWLATEALFRYIFHTALALARPPLAHPCLLSIPPHLNPVVVDHFHALLFERLLIPQLLVATRPFFAAAAAGVLSAAIVDIGARGDGLDISVVHESQVVEAATLCLPIDEGVLDDWTCLMLLQEDPTLPSKIVPSEQNGAAPALVLALRRIVEVLKAKNAIGFAPAAIGNANSTSVDENEGEFDVARAIVEGKVDKIVGKKKVTAQDEETTGDFVDVPSPLDAEKTIKIGPARRRYLEPLFTPELIEQLRPSASPEAAMLNLTEYEGREVLHTGIQEAIGLVIDQVEDVEQRRLVWESIVIVSVGKVATNKTLGAALIPQIEAYVIDPDSGSESQPKIVKYARTPDYFSEFKERSGELAVYLGGCIMAKILISDLQSRLFMVSITLSKVDYTNKGPAFYRQLEKTM